MKAISFDVETLEECNRTVWDTFSAEEHESLPLSYVYFLHNLMSILQLSQNPGKKRGKLYGVTPTHGRSTLQTEAEKTGPVLRKICTGHSGKSLLNRREEIQRRGR